MIVLELGVGHHQQTSEWWEHLSARVVGVDLRSIGQTDVVADMEQPLPFRSQSVDGVWSSHMFEHLSQPGAQQLLRECFRVIRPGGELRMYMPNFTYWAEQYFDHGIDKSLRENILGEQGYPTDFHRSLWDEKTLKDALYDADFIPMYVGRGRTNDELYCLAVRP